jgi:hypothetical protein
MKKTFTPWFGLGWGLSLGLGRLVLSEYNMAQDQQGEDTDVVDSKLDANSLSARSKISVMVTRAC